ncbi:MAG: sugar efflux transporter [Opitutus sp.]|nr:sugar efflux transporter [Opitutus sp.]
MFLDAIKTMWRQPGYVGILAANFALGMAYSFVVPFMSLWGTKHIGMTPLVFGTFMALTSVSAMVLSVWLAKWSDSHVTRRTMLLAGGAAGAVGYIGYAYVSNVFALTVIGAIFLGIASVNFSQLFAHMREELARPENASVNGPLLMSVLRVSFSLAWTFGPAVGAWVMVQFGYRGIFLGAAALFVVFLAGVAAFVPHRPHPPMASQPKREPLLQVLTRRDLLTYFIGFTLVFAALNISMMNLPLMVTQQLGGTERHVGIIYSIAPFFEVPLMIWFSHLAARGYQMAIMRLGVVMSVLYFGVLIFVQTPWHIYPAQVLNAVSIAITTNVVITFFQDLLPGRTGLATSIYSNSFNGGTLLGYFLFGLLLNTFGYRGVFVICTLFSLITLALLFVRWKTPVPAAAQLESAP